MWLQTPWPVPTLYYYFISIARRHSEFQAKIFILHENVLSTNVYDFEHNVAKTKCIHWIYFVNKIPYT